MFTRILIPIAVAAAAGIAGAAPNSNFKITKVSVGSGRTTAVDRMTHKAFLLAVEYGPPSADSPAPAPGGFPAGEPGVGAQFTTISLQRSAKM